MNTTNRRQLAHLHVPKTSGMSFVSAVEDALETNNVVRAMDLCLFGSEEMLEGMPPATKSAIVNDSSALRPDARLIVGHLSFSTIKAAYPNALIFSVLREPRTRLISLWLFWRSISASNRERWGRAGAMVQAADNSLWRFCADPIAACQTDNCATRMLLWPNPVIPTTGFIKNEDDDLVLKAALEKLDALGFVGLYEDPNLDDRFSKFIGRPFMRSVVNETAGSATPPPRLSDVANQRTREILNQRSRLDLKLWERLWQNDTMLHYSANSADNFMQSALLKYIEKGLLIDR